VTRKATRGKRGGTVSPVGGTLATASAVVFFTPLETIFMYYTYILQSKKDRRWYTGCTKDLRKRFDEHQKGLSYSTKRRGHLNVYITKHAWIEAMLLQEKNI